jgi:hypothetical protein
MYTLILLKPHAEALLLWLNEQWVTGKSHINKEYFRLDNTEHTTLLSLSYANTNLNINEQRSLVSMRDFALLEDYPLERITAINTLQQYYDCSNKKQYYINNDDISIDWENQLERFYTYQLLKLIE